MTEQELKAQQASFNINDGLDRYDALYVVQMFVGIAGGLVTLWNFRKVLIEAQVTETAKKHLNQNGKVIFVSAIVLIALLGFFVFYIFKKIQDSNRERQTANTAIAAAATTAVAQATTQAAQAATTAAATATQAAATANAAATVVAESQIIQPNIIVR
jgi:uncharacterized protein HemX